MSPPAGEFNRDTNYITTRITADGGDGYPVEPGRYRLIVAGPARGRTGRSSCAACSAWKPVLSIGICGPTHDERSWTFDLDPGGVDPVLGIPRLQRRVLQRVPGLPQGHHRARDRRRRHRRGGHQRLRPDDAGPVDAVDRVPPRRRAAAVPGAAARRDRRGRQAHLHRGQQRRVPLRVRRHRRRPTTQAYDRLFTALDWAHRPAGQRSATWWATPSPRPTSGCSPRWPGSTRSTTATSSATGPSWPRCRCCGPTPATCSRRRDSATPPTSCRSRQHYYIVHADINPDADRAEGPELASWLTPHGREALGGRPFGDGTPPGPTLRGRTCSRRSRSLQACGMALIGAHVDSEDPLDAAAARRVPRRSSSSSAIRRAGRSRRRASARRRSCAPVRPHHLHPCAVPRQRRLHQQQDPHPEPQDHAAACRGGRRHRRQGARRARRTCHCQGRSDGRSGELAQGVRAC